MGNPLNNYEIFTCHPCKNDGVCIDQCHPREADFWGVYTTDNYKTHPSEHLFDCYSEIDAKDACALLNGRPTSEYSWKKFTDIKSRRYEVLTVMAFGDPENIWSLNDKPLTFDSRSSAQAEINDFIDDLKKAVNIGDIQDSESLQQETYIIAEVKSWETH
tara:strand:- start:899 stop:1378 length:480 start_codon:yes stop_codon:yes gene_type:complete